MSGLGLILVIKSGCPQGTYLGAVLFIIFINVIQNECDILIFADDTTDPPQLVFGPNIIERGDQRKHLELIISYNLDWTAHVNFICLKANRKLNVLRSVHYLDKHWTCFIS